jgi:hypothetical protein
MERVMMPSDHRLPSRVVWGLALVACIASSACVTVRPEQRAVMADPTMQFNNDPGDGAARDHVLENREGSSGGKSVKGGGCGCN